MPVRDGSGGHRRARRDRGRLGQDRRSTAPTARGSSSTASTGRSRSRRCGSLEAATAGVEAVDARDARRRLPDGAVRADGPRSGSTSTSPPRAAVWDRPRATRIASGRRRSRRRLVASGRLGRKTGAAGSIGTTTARREAVRSGVRRPGSRPANLGRMRDRDADRASPSPRRCASRRTRAMASRRGRHRARPAARRRPPRSPFATWRPSSQRVAGRVPAGSGRAHTIPA